MGMLSVAHSLSLQKNEMACCRQTGYTFSCTLPDMDDFLSQFKKMLEIMWQEVGQIGSCRKGVYEENFISPSKNGIFHVDLVNDYNKMHVLGESLSECKGVTTKSHIPSTTFWWEVMTKRFHFLIGGIFARLGSVLVWKNITGTQYVFVFFCFFFTKNKCCSLARINKIT